MSANVHSLEAIDTVRVALVKFDDQVRDALTGLEVEMRRMLEWLEHDRPKYWKLQMRRANDQAHEAQQALHRCLMFPIADERPSCYEERAALKAAQARHAYCQEKAERVRRWQQTVQHELFEYQGRISRLVRLVEVDTPQAIGVLEKIMNRLEEYQSIHTTNPRNAYNDVALVNEVWSENPNPAGEAASAAEAVSAAPRGTLAAPVTPEGTGGAAGTRAEPVALEQSPKSPIELKD